VKVSICVGVKLFAKQCPKTQEEKEYMESVSYASTVGSLISAMVYTRLDISHAVGVLSRYMSTPRKENWTLVKRVFKYLRGTKNKTFFYQGKLEYDMQVDVHGFFYSDWAGDVDGRRSTNGAVFKIFIGVVSWMSRRQSVVALSTTEA